MGEANRPYSPIISQEETEFFKKESIKVVRIEDKYKVIKSEGVIEPYHPVQSTMIVNPILSQP